LLRIKLWEPCDRNKEEKKTMENKEENKMSGNKNEKVSEKKPVEMTQEEMEKGVGGNIFEDAACFVFGHDASNWVERKCGRDPNFDLVKCICSRCGKTVYVRYNKNTEKGDIVNISDQEYNAY
jgi:hypothetical protein